MAPDMVHYSCKVRKNSIETESITNIFTTISGGGEGEIWGGQHLHHKFHNIGTNFHCRQFENPSQGLIHIILPGLCSYCRKFQTYYPLNAFNRHYLQVQAQQIGKTTSTYKIIIPLKMIYNVSQVTYVTYIS